MSLLIGLVGIALGAIGAARVVTLAMRYVRRALAGARAYFTRGAARRDYKRRMARESDPRRLQAVATLALAEALATLAAQARDARREGRR